MSPLATRKARMSGANGGVLCPGWSDALFGHGQVSPSRSSVGLSLAESSTTATLVCCWSLDNSLDSISPVNLFPTTDVTVRPIP